MKKNVKRLDRLKAKKDQLNAQIQALEAAENARERKRATRRKILVGAYYIEQTNTDAEQEAMRQRMDGYLTRDSDRTLFGLAPRDVKS